MLWHQESAQPPFQNNQSFLLLLDRIIRVLTQHIVFNQFYSEINDPAMLSHFSEVKKFKTSTCNLKKYIINLDHWVGKNPWKRGPSENDGFIWVIFNLPNFHIAVNNWIIAIPSKDMASNLAWRLRLESQYL